MYYVEIIRDRKEIFIYSEDTYNKRRDIIQQVSEFICEKRVLQDARNEAKIFVKKGYHYKEQLKAENHIFSGTVKETFTFDSNIGVETFIKGEFFIIRHSSQLLKWVVFKRAGEFCSFTKEEVEKYFRIV